MRLRCLSRPPTTINSDRSLSAWVAREEGRHAQIGRAVSPAATALGRKNKACRPIPETTASPTTYSTSKAGGRSRITAARALPCAGLRSKPDITVFIGATRNSLILARLHNSPCELEAQFTPAFPSLASPDATSESAATSRQRFAPGNPSVTPSVSALHRQTPSAHTDKAET